MSSLYGLKPSHGRLPYKGVANTVSTVLFILHTKKKSCKNTDPCKSQMEGQNIVPSVMGPIAHSPGDLELITKVILNAEPWQSDPQVVKLPWQSQEQDEIREKAKSSGLAFGVMKWDGMVMPHPPIQRGLEETIEKLKKQGHEVRSEPLQKAPALAFGLTLILFCSDHRMDTSVSF